MYCNREEVMSHFEQRRIEFINLLVGEKANLNTKLNAVNSVIKIMEPQQKKLDFHNTINETGERLTELRENAKTQQEKILRFFYQNSIFCYTPFQVRDNVLPLTPITSVRRAITNPTNQGHLIKEALQVVEKYGVKNNYWSFNANGPHGNKYKE